jgi:hypothetical protein
LADASTDAGGPSCDIHAGGGASFVDDTVAWGLSNVVGNRIVRPTSTVTDTRSHHPRHRQQQPRDDRHAPARLGP